MADHAEEDPPAARPVHCAVWLAGDPMLFLPALQSLPADVPVIVGALHGLTVPTLIEARATKVVRAWEAHHFLRTVAAQAEGHLAVMGDPVIAPPDVFGPAVRLLDADLRIASVSYPSNAAGIVSVPYRFTPIDRPFDGIDTAGVTALLRRDDAGCVPIPHADGGLVVFSADIVAVLLEEAETGPGGTMAGVVTDLSLAARRRGFINVVDLTTYLACPGDLSDGAMKTLAAQDREWVLGRHRFISELLDRERTAPETAMAIGLRSVRVSVQGLRILLDGSCLGPNEMGTQVALVSMLSALCERPEVHRVGVTLPGAVPAYASAALAHPKVVTGSVDPARLGEILGHVEIGHRPFQPDVHFDIGAWRQVCDRVAVSILDLIAYQVGAYHRDGTEWLQYRDVITGAARSVDGVSVISDDVRRHIELERLPIDGSRVFVVPLGTEHLTGNEPRRTPRLFEDPAMCARPFMLCLGTNYSHKNRDLAIRLHQLLAAEGRDLALVLAGSAVPTGSSRVSEARAMVGVAAGDVLVLPDVDSEERNWLLHHACLLLYPTSAEGFGLVPFEAARFSTPSLAVSFGPIRELGGDGVVAPSSWNLSEMSAAAATLLDDPEAARSQVTSILHSGAEFTWSRCASGMLSMYRWLLDRPSRA